MKRILSILFFLAFIQPSEGRADSVTLDTFLDKVIKHSNELKLANQDLAYAGATKKEAVAGALPNITATAGYNRNLADNYMYVDFGDEPSKFKINRNNEYSLNLTVNQTLFSGAVYNAIRAANEYGKLTEYMYRSSENDIITLAKKSFYQTLLLKEVFEVSKLSEQNAQENFNNINNGYDIGLKSEFEKLQAEVRYKELIPQTTAAERNYNIALINLKNMAGIDLERSIEITGELTIYPLMPENISLENILTLRPDYNALLWEEKLRTTGVKAEKAGQLPTLNGFFSYNYSAQSDDFKLEDENNSYTVGLKLNLPIFTGGRTSAKIRQAKIELNRRRINKDRAVDNIKTETKNIRLRLLESFNRIESAQSSLETAQKAFEIAQATAEAGLTTQLELKDSRVVLDQAQVNYFSAIYEYLDAYFDWEKATGRVMVKNVLLN